MAVHRQHRSPVLPGAKRATLQQLETEYSGHESAIQKERICIPGQVPGQQSKEIATACMHRNINPRT